MNILFKDLEDHIESWPLIERITVQRRDDLGKYYIIHYDESLKKTIRNNSGHKKSIFAGLRTKKFYISFWSPSEYRVQANYFATRKNKTLKKFNNLQDAFYYIVSKTPRYIDEIEFINAHQFLIEQIEFIQEHKAQMVQSSHEAISSRSIQLLKNRENFELKNKGSVFMSNCANIDIYRMEPPFKVYADLVNLFKNFICHFINRENDLGRKTLLRNIDVTRECIEREKNKIMHLLEE